MSGIFFAWAAAGAIAAEPAEVDYLRDIKPLLAAHCIQCHGPKKQENGLRLDAAKAILLGGDNGPAITPGKAGESLLIQAITGESDIISQMPPKGAPLTADQVALLSRWIDSGAKAPAEAIAQAAQSSHWAFQKPVRSPLPAVRDAAWPASPIDTFILAALEKRSAWLPRPKPSGPR